MNFSLAKDFGDVIAIAFDDYSHLKSPASVTKNPGYLPLLKSQIKAIEKGVLPFSSLEGDYQALKDDLSRGDYLLSLLRALNLLGSFDELALEKSGLLNSVLLDRYLVLPMGDQRLSSRLENLRYLRDIHDKATIEDAFHFFKIVRVDQLLFHPTFQAFSYGSSQSFSSLFQSKTTLRFLAFPFFLDNCEKYLSFTYSEKDKTFSIQGSRDGHLERYFSSLKKLSTDSPDFVVFSEMSLPKDALPQMKTLLSQYSLKDSLLFIGGSLWADQANTSFVFDRDGHLLMSQKKFSNFLQEKEGDSTKTYREDNRFSVPPEIAVLEMKGIGRISVFICKDVIKRNIFENIVSSLALDLMFVIAYSSSREIERDLPGIATSCHTSIILVNACFPGKEGCKAYLPCLKDDSQSSYEEKVFEPCDKKNCSAFCSGRSLSLDIKGESAKMMLYRVNKCEQ